jgi:hypothetical protein
MNGTAGHEPGEEVESMAKKTKREPDPKGKKDKKSKK